MKKVTAFVGTPRKKATYHAVRQLLDNLEAQGDVACEIVMLSDYRLELCRGCKSCFVNGEERCPLKDDRDALIAKMMASDGVVFATPNYSFQVSAQMKLFLDRLGYVFHRPRFFEKTFTSVVVQGIYGGRTIERYLDFVGGAMGFKTVKGSCVTTLDPMSEKERRKIERAVEKQSRRFHAALMQPALPAPSWLGLMAFRLSRTSMRLALDARNRDFTYYREKGWFESGYYYPVRMGALKTLAGRLLDWIAARMAGKGREPLCPGEPAMPADAPRSDTKASAA